MEFQIYVALICYRKEQFEAAFDTLKQEDPSGGPSYIPVHTLRKILTSLGETMEVDEVQDLINEMDMYNDGKIGQEEFMQILLSN